MPTVLPQNNKFIFSRIIFELAEAIKKAPENRFHIDQAIIIAATPDLIHKNYLPENITID